MSKVDYLNLGCGNKFHKDWVNVDIYSNSPHVKSWNLKKGIPFKDNSFSVVYLSEVVEHFEKGDAQRLINECYRVLKPNGIIRVVTPDLEDLAKNYLQFLKEIINNPTEQNKANYEWILLEMYDQTVRNQAGGEMARFLQKPIVVNEQYVIGRIGFVGKRIREEYLKQQKNSNQMSLNERNLRYFINHIYQEVQNPNWGLLSVYF